ncbi:OsmC family peroxiredoxin [Paracoccus luteus]|uniref:OsmC family peroxiredoxin n=1 Tax=Paracoccus luteus TaxID=2508543 RepID=UPI00106FB84E|nr:OsmC family peroxiredoxin [Paracoccus luteus]
MITKTGSAKWKGGFKDGSGEVSTESGALSAQPYGVRARFEGQPGTNPEELIGAAHAACFSMALSKVLADDGITGVSIQTTSAIGLDQESDGFAIKTAHLTTAISGSGDESAIRAAAEKAKLGCPVSKLLKADITMDVSVG